MSLRDKLELDVRRDEKRLLFFSLSSIEKAFSVSKEVLIQKCCLPSAAHDSELLVNPKRPLGASLSCLPGWSRRSLRYMLKRKYQKVDGMVDGFFWGVRCHMVWVGAGIFCGWWQMKISLSWAVLAGIVCKKLAHDTLREPNRTDATQRKTTCR